MKFFQKIQNAIGRFMYGRTGVDQLGLALLITELVLSIIGGMISNSYVSSAVSLLSLVCVFLFLFRMFSKNTTKRASENWKFLSIWNRFTGKWKAAVGRVKDKDHKYFRCKCGAYCRVPKGKGKIVITCPKCGAKIKGKS